MLSNEPKPTEPDPRWTALATYQFPTGDHASNAFLDILKRHEAAGLALQMVDSGSERGEVPPAAALGTMIQSLLVYHPVSPIYQQGCSTGTPGGVLTDWRPEVLVETGKLAEQFVAEVALIAAAGPGSLGRFIGWLLTPADEFLSDDAARILGPHQIVEVFAVHIDRFRAGASLYVVHNTTGGGEALRAKWARSVRATVAVGIEMLELVSDWSS